QVAAAHVARSAGEGVVRARSDCRGAGYAQVRDCVERRVRAVVERVVVGERYDVDTELGEPVGGDRRRAEEERLARISEAGPARRDAALEVEHERVGAGD